jgi:hypothetical protein
MSDQASRWSEALAELRGRMDRRTFDNLLRDSFLVSVEPGAEADGPEQWRVAVRNPDALLWLPRYRRQIDDTASLVAGRPATVAFEVATPETPAVDEAVQPPPGEDASAHRSPASRPRDAPRNAGGPPRRQGSSPAPSRPAAAPTRPQPSRLAAFDVESTGWSKLPHYVLHFWWRLLGPYAGSVWLLVRSADTRPNPTPWTPGIRLTVTQILGATGADSRRVIAGASRTCNGRDRRPRGPACPNFSGRGGREDGDVCRCHQPGALDMLEAEGVAVIERPGPGARCGYLICVCRSLPLLTPHQVSRLDSDTQKRHATWLQARGLDLKSWARLTARHLVAPPKG